MTDYERGYIDGLYDAVGELCELITIKVNHYKGDCTSTNTPTMIVTQKGVFGND